MSSPLIHFTIEYDPNDSRRDPKALAQLLGAACNDVAQGGDASSICPTFLCHLRTLQGAVREFISVPVIREPYADSCTKNTFKPEWMNLFTLMFHCYFQHMQGSGYSTTPHDPLIDALLLSCDFSDFEVLSQAPGFKSMLCLLLSCISEALPSPHTPYDRAFFLKELCMACNIEKSLRISVRTTSLMPWSITSIKEGSLSTPAPASEQARIPPVVTLIAILCNNPLTFPDMLWLGASHDGYPRYSSLTSYVTARWSPSFTANDNAALWQSVMTFGVLEAITDLKIPEALLLEKQMDGTIVLTCRNMGVLVYHWIFRVLLDETEDHRRMKHSSDTLSRAIRALSSACDPADRETFNGLSQLAQNDVDDIICAISILLLAFHIPTERSLIDDAFHDPYVEGNCMQRVADIFLYKMVAGGWCPSLPRPFRMCGFPQYWWYAATFKPFVRHNQFEHAECSKIKCVVHSMDEATYRTLHISSQCSCPFISPSMDSLSRILGSGRIPVISYSAGVLTVHSATDGLPYIAISHVWADGLGSTTEKGLPTCQIERIHRHVQGLLGSTALAAFWIDGLCIPEDRTLRNKAIVMMRQTYEDAAKVLVFDSSIRTLCSSANSVEENVFRISMSTWMQRVWTLQEALLARELYFEFSTGVASAANLSQNLARRASFGAPWVTTALVIESNTPTRSVLDPSITGKKPTFLEIIALLYRRSTSKPKDEPLAIAGLLNVDSKMIISQPDLERRIQTLFVEVGTIPKGLIFRDFERMNTPGFRWCPISLTCIGDLYSYPDQECTEAICTPHGLTTKGEILVIRLPNVCALQGMDPLLFVHIPSIEAFYSLQELLRILPKDGSCSINALLLEREPHPLPMGTSFQAVAVYVPEVQHGRDSDVTQNSPLVCEYITRTEVGGFGSTWSSVMEGHPMIEGRLVSASVMVT